MSYVNTARKSQLLINGVDESARMISWRANDDSVFKNGIMRTSGQVVLGTTSLTQYDYQREAYKRGQIVQMSLWDSDSSQWQVHPRGFLYVLSTSFNAESQEVSIEIGCRLALWTVSDNVDEMYEYSIIDLEDGQKTIQNISQGLYSSNKAIYQDNTGNIIEIDTLDLDVLPDDPSGVPAGWTSGSRVDVLSAGPLVNDQIPDMVEMEYSYSASSVFSAQEKTSVDTSDYEIGFNASTWVREGSGSTLNSVETIDDSYSGLPGAAIGDYKEVVNIEKVLSSRTETTMESFNGPGGQLSRSVQESYQPGLEVKAEYFEDQYSACRYQAALDGDADSTACSYLQATSPILASRVIRTINYNDAGTVLSERRELWKPVLAAAQSFNWKSGDGDSGQPLNFTPISLTDIFRASVVDTEYVQNEEGDNIETITTYRSGAEEYSAGIYASTGVIGTAELSVSEPVSYPDIQGLTSLGLATEAVSGSGSGMTVNVGWPSSSGSISELTVTSSLLDCQWGVRPVDGILSWYPLGAIDDTSEALGNKFYSGMLYWGALPDTGIRKSGSWTGGSGSGFDGYVPSSSLPSIFSNITYSLNRTTVASRWTISVTSTDFTAPSNEVISVLDGGSGYAIGDVITWTNNVTSAIQFGSAYAGMGRTLATDYGQNLNSTTITAEVTGVNYITPLITIAEPGTGYNVGDEIRVTAAVISASIGETVTEDLVFTITSGSDGITDLGEGIASLSLTDYSFSGGGAPTDQYASSSGTTRWDFRYNQGDIYPSTITSTGGSNGITGRFGAYDPEGEGIVGTPQISPLAVRNKGLLIIDNGYIRSPGISGSLIGTPTSNVDSPEFCWESWIFVDTMSPKGMALCHWGTSTYPSTSGNWMTTNVYQTEIGWGAYMRNGNVNILAFSQFRGSDDYFQSPQGIASAPYPTGEWFHLAIVADNDKSEIGVNNGKWHIYINGQLEASGNRTSMRVTSNTLYCYTGAGGFEESELRAGYDFENLVSVPPASNADYLRVALSQTRLKTGSVVYSSNFTPIDPDPTPSGGGTALAGIYEGLEGVAVDGIGKAATLNLEIINGGSSGAGGTGWDPVFVSPALQYTADIGQAAATGGTGTGLILGLGVGYSGETYSGQAPIVIRTVVDGGSGYQNGDILTIPISTIEALLVPYGGGTVDNNLRFSVTPSQTSAAASAWLFPNVVGTQFAVGDSVKVTRTEVQAAGGGDPGQDITASVTAITPAKPMQNLTLDALDGGKTVVVNTSKTDSTLPNNPDSNATPSLPTLESSSSVTIRTNAYDPAFGGIPDIATESLQVPLEYASGLDVTSFVEKYSQYLKTFITGEGYGLRIGEAMKPEIMNSWAPMTGFRYIDQRTGDTFAMRADAASWGVSTEEAAVVYNGIWLGEVVYSASSGTTIDGGNFTTDVTLALDSDIYDGGDVTTDTSSATNDDILSGGNFTTGLADNPEDYLEAGKILQYTFELSFDAAQTWTLRNLGTGGTYFVDWENTGLIEEFTTTEPTHDYQEGNYVLSCYRDSANNRPTTDLNHNGYGGDAEDIISAHLAPSFAGAAFLGSAFRTCYNLTSFTVSPDADMTTVTSFTSVWRDCHSLPSFPFFEISATNAFASAWRNCYALADFPPHFFDNFAVSSGSNPFGSVFLNCALSAESIENVLVSLDAMPLLPTDPAITNITISINGGTNAGYSTWTTTAQAALTSLQAKGWNMVYNS